MVIPRCRAFCLVAFAAAGAGSGALIAWWLTHDATGSTDPGALWFALTTICGASAAIGSLVAGVPRLASSTSIGVPRVFLSGVMATCVAILLASALLSGVEALWQTEFSITGWAGMSGLLLFWASIMFGLPGVAVGGLTALVVRELCRKS